MLLDLVIAGLALAWVGIVTGACLGWQLLRQNGRLLLRIEALEEFLNELELGETATPADLTLGSDAPAFELPDLQGQRKSLNQYRGESALLIFFNPACGFCRELLPRLGAKLESIRHKPEMETASHESPDSALRKDPLVLIVTTGEVGAHRQLFDEHNLACPVLLQKDSEVASAYQANGTPSGYLVSPDGKIASELAIGADALLDLLADKTKIVDPESRIPSDSKDRMEAKS